MRKLRWIVNPGSLTLNLSGLPCRKCDKCLRVRAAQWRARAMKEIANAQRTWFVTLTLSPDWHQRSFMQAIALKNTTGWLDTDFDEAEREFRLRAMGIGRIFTLYAKKVRKSLAGSDVSFKYLQVLEKHQTGLPHVHALFHEVQGQLTYRKICDSWTYGFSQAKLVSEDRKAAGYVTKYIAKSSLARVRASLHYGDGFDVLNGLAVHSSGRGTPSVSDGPRPSLSHAIIDEMLSEAKLQEKSFNG